MRLEPMKKTRKTDADSRRYPSPSVALARIALSAAVRAAEIADDMDRKVRLTVHVPAELKTALEAAAVRRHVTLSGYVGELLAEHTPRYRSKPTGAEKAQASIRRRAKKLRGEGLSFQAIAGKLNASGYTTPRGRAFGWQSVRRLLGS